jgi:hypothetical protein
VRGVDVGGFEVGVGVRWGGWVGGGQQEDQRRPPFGLRSSEQQLPAHLHARLLQLRRDLGRHLARLSVQGGAVLGHHGVGDEHGVVAHIRAAQVEQPGLRGAGRRGGQQGSRAVGWGPAGGAAGGRTSVLASSVAAGPGARRRARGHVPSIAQGPAPAAAVQQATRGATPAASQAATHHLVQHGHQQRVRARASHALPRHAKLVSHALARPLQRVQPDGRRRRLGPLRAPGTVHQVAVGQQRHQVLACGRVVAARGR